MSPSLCFMWGTFNPTMVQSVETNHVCCTAGGLYQCVYYTEHIKCLYWGYRECSSELSFNGLNGEPQLTSDGEVHLNVQTLLGLMSPNVSRTCNENSSRASEIWRLHTVSFSSVNTDMKVENTSLYPNCSSYGLQGAGANPSCHRVEVGFTPDRAVTQR